MKLPFLCLLAALALLLSATTTRACQYCRMAADDPEMARLAAEMHARSGGFPLDTAINGFQPNAQSPVLTAPPPAASITTRAADLPTTALPVAATHRLPPPAVAKSPLPAPPAANPSAPPSTANRWANGGLLGLLGLAGIFGWRTRRNVGSAS